MLLNNEIPLDIPIRKTIIKKIDNNKFLYLQDKMKPKPLHTACGAVNSRATVQNRLAVLQKVKHMQEDREPRNEPTHFSSVNL